MIKKFVQEQLYKRAFKDYTQMVDNHSNPYKQWYLANEEYKNTHYDTTLGEAVVFADKNGITEGCARGVFEDYFAKNPRAILAYGDEDILEEKDGEYIRKDPWFKPCFSPDTLASFQYYGHIFAIRKTFLSRYPKEEWEGFMDDTSSLECYNFLLKITRDILKDFPFNPSVNIINSSDGPTGFINRDPRPIVSISKVLIHMRQCLPDVFGCYEENILYLTGNETYKKPSLKEVSVIIPSMDNIGVLRTCITSLINITAPGEGPRQAAGGESPHQDESGERPHIIVVDNGSPRDAKAKLEIMAKELGFDYIYEPMAFNFSKMCNIGASKAKGSYLLFLNDDMEIIEPGWLSKMLFCGGLPHVGACGAKLLYPGTDLIQHAGVTNIKAGPVHKLQKLSDGEMHYHGRNKYNQDMIAVTAACLLMKKEKYSQIGGFKEEIAVSYNDVELCFSLLEAGYYNVYRGDVILYHHESLSRGDDNLSDEKWKRLLEEKDRLYGFHPSLKSYDPFYSKNLAVHSNLYIANHVYDFERRDYLTGIRPYKGKDPKIWEHEALMVNVEHARQERRLETSDREDIYWIEGWSYILNNDNARYKRFLILVSPSGKAFKVDILDRYRDDVVEVLPGQINVELAGFVARIPYGILREKEYRIGMVAADKCSRQKLFKMSDKTMVITQNL